MRKGSCNPTQIIGTAPRARICLPCKRDDEIVLGGFSGIARTCQRCGVTMIAGIIAQGPTPMKAKALPRKR